MTRSLSIVQVLNGMVQVGLLDLMRCGVIHNLHIHGLTPHTHTHTLSPTSLHYYNVFIITSA